jgi:hypothetical protein
VQIPGKISPLFFSLSLSPSLVLATTDLSG